MSARILTATRLGLREQSRRPLLLLLLVVVPVLFITWSFLVTEPLPRLITLPGDEHVATDMRELHGAIMVPITAGFLGGLIGLFVVQAALEADRRLVVAGYRPIEAIVPRLVVMTCGTVLVLVVALGVTAADFTPRQWGPFVVGNLLAGLTYAALGAIAGALIGRVGAAQLMFFAPMLDFGVVQNPMFFDGAPQGWAVILPGWGATRTLVDGAFGPGFEATVALLVALGWVVVLATAVAAVLRRAVGGTGMTRTGRAGP